MKRVVLKYWTDKNYYEGMAYCELRKLRWKNVEESVDYTMDGKNVRVSAKCRKVYFLGNKSFVKTEERGWFSYKGGRFYGVEPYVVFSAFPEEVRVKVLEDIGLDWMRDTPDSLLKFAMKKNLFKSVLTHSIYNQETLVKAIGKRVYRLKNFSWKVLRDYIVTGQDFSIWDLQCFTKNMEESMKVLISISMDWKNEYSREKRTLMKDMLNMAANENGIVDFRWSERRMQQEHLQQIERAHARDLEAMTDTPLYTEKEVLELSHPDIYLLKSEKEIFFEGARMHHCLYDSYFRSIKNKVYVAFHMNSPEDCTFGVRLNKNRAVLDQIYLKYDRAVEPETKDIARAFVEEHEGILLGMQLMGMQYGENWEILEPHDLLPF